MSEVLEDAMDRLSRVPGLRGAMVVDPGAGVPVTAELEGGVQAKALAALAASLFQRTGQASRGAGFGGTGTVQLEASGGHLVIAGTAELLVVSLAESDAQLGMIRLETQRAVKALETG